jgi:hypothetical protein
VSIVGDRSRARRLQSFAGAGTTDFTGRVNDDEAARTALLKSWSDGDRQS